MFWSISRGGKPTDNAGVGGNAALYREQLGRRLGGIFLGYRGGSSEFGVGRNPECLAVDFGGNLGVFDRGAGEPRRGRLLPIRGIWSVDNWEPTKGKAQARKLRYLSNPVKAKAKLAT